MHEILETCPAAKFVLAPLALSRSLYGFYKRRRETIKRLRFEYFAMSDRKTQDI